MATRLAPTLLAVELARDMGFITGRLPALPSAQSSPAELAVLHRHLTGEDPVRLKLIKNTKGYSWEISVAEKDPQAALSAIQDLEQRVKATFGSIGEAEEPQPVTPAPEKRNGAHPNGKPVPLAAPALAQEPTTESPDFEQLCQTMQHCLNAAYGVWEKLEVDLPFTTEDVGRVGINLFQECSRKGILPQASGEGRPF